MVSRVHFDHKDFTWDLVLREVHRWYHMRMVPPCFLLICKIGATWINSMGHISILFSLQLP
jgi:hypothetical protein